MYFGPTNKGIVVDDKGKSFSFNNELDAYKFIVDNLKNRIVEKPQADKKDGEYYHIPKVIGVCHTCRKGNATELVLGG